MDIYGDIEVIGSGHLFNNGEQVKYANLRKVANDHERDQLRPLFFSGYIGIFASGTTSDTLYYGTSVSSYLNLLTSGNSVFFGSLYDTCWGRSGTAISNGSNNRALFAGGSVSGGWCTMSAISITINSIIYYITDHIDYVTISTTSTSIPFGDLYQHSYQLAGVSNGTNNKGLFAGSFDGSNVISTINISTSGNSTYFADMDYGGSRFQATDNGVLNRAVFQPVSKLVKKISHVAIDTAADAQLFGSLTFSDTDRAVMSNDVGNRALFIGGGSSDVAVGVDGVYTNHIEYINISVTSNAYDFGDLSTGRWGSRAVSNGIGNVGVAAGGCVEIGTDYYKYGAYYTNTIEKININFGYSTSFFGNLYNGYVFDVMATSNGSATISNISPTEPLRLGEVIITLDDHALNIPIISYLKNSINQIYKANIDWQKLIPRPECSGIFCGGYTGSSITAEVEKINLVTKGDGRYFCNLSAALDRTAATSNGSAGRAIIGGGGGGVATIRYIDIVKSSSSSFFGNLSSGRYGLAGVSNGLNNRAVFAGGLIGRTTIDYISISTLGDAVFFGNLVNGRGDLAGASNGINNRAIFAGGYESYNVIDLINITNITDAVYFGTLLYNTTGVCATSNGRGNRAMFGGGTATKIYPEGSTIGVPGTKYTEGLDGISAFNIMQESSCVIFGTLRCPRVNCAAITETSQNLSIFSGGSNVGSTALQSIDSVNLFSVNVNSSMFSTLRRNRARHSATSNGE